MIAACTNCQARYQLEDEKIPQRMIKVRCPQCQGVFALDGTQAGVVPEAPPAAAFVETPDPVAVTPPLGLTQDNSFDPVEKVVEQEPVFTPPEVELESEPVVSAPVAPTPAAAPVAQPEAANVSAAVATLDEPAPSSNRRRRCKEEMLARALVSDILVYNRETRDAGLAEGNLLEALGGEIKKSWELYKEKVTPEVANSTTYFREALNEILADGQSVF